MSKIYLYGTSGHAKVVIDILQQNGLGKLILLDDDPKVNNLNEYKVYDPKHMEIDPKAKFLVSIGENKTRKRIADKIENSFLSAIIPKRM